MLLNCYAAVCFPLCKNGGNCTAPGFCGCPREWEGLRCEERMFSIFTNIIKMHVNAIHISQLAVLLLVIMVARVSDLGNVIALHSGRVMIAKMV